MQSRVEIERMRREFLCSSSQAMKMENSFDAVSERECSICFFDLHLSAAGCHCSPDKYACLNHTKQLCPCAWGDKFFLFRYDISELNILVEALEGKLSAIYRWSRLDLGLSLSSYVSRDSSGNGNSHSGKGLEASNAHPFFKSVKDEQGIDVSKETKVVVVALPSQDTKLSKSGIALPKIEMPSIRSPLKRVENNSKTLVGAKPIVKKTSVLEHDTVILLSDDESDDPKKPASVAGKKTLAAKQLDVSAAMDAPEMDREVGCSLPNGGTKNSLSSPVICQDELQGNHGQVGFNPPKNPLDAPSLGLGYGKGNQESLTICANGDHNPQLSGVGLPENGAPYFGEHARASNGNASSSQNNLDRFHRQKGPRIAKVVRRITCAVEALEYGVVLSGKSWCNSQAIFPKGLSFLSFFITLLKYTKY